MKTLKTKLWLPLVAAGLALAGQQAGAQTKIAQWTFENLTISAGSSLTNFSNGRSITNIPAEFGSGTASASHPGSPAFGAGTWSTVAGNGSAKALTSAGWTNNSTATSGDYYQFAFGTIGITNINITFDAVGSATGPRDFAVQYSTDGGVTFTPFGSSYAVLSSPSWNATTAQSGETYTYDFSSITAMADKSVIYIRLVVTGNTAINGSSIGTGGTSRIDNFTVFGTIPGPAQIINQPPNTTNFFGDTVNISVFAGGNAPLSFQWFTNSTPLTPLADGPSGYGSGTYAGTTNSTLTITFANTNQTGNYRVVVSNLLNAVTSSVVHLQVNVRTPIVTNILYIRKLHDTNFVVTDITNLYTIEGIVTTPINLVSGPTEVESFFMQDTNGVGCDVFFRGGFTMPNQGDHVRVTAPLGQFNGLTEVSPINGNPAHSIVVLDTGNPVPAPQLFDFTTLPTPTNMEEQIEGKYMIVSNVFINVSTADAGHFAAGDSVFMTNQFGKGFNALVPNNPAIDIVGTALPGTFATFIRGVMSQSTTAAVPTNGYSILLAQGADIQIGSPVTANPDSYSMASNTTSLFAVLTNDTILSAAIEGTLTVTAVTTTNGSAAVDGTGTNITFTPDTDFTGTLTIGYTATDTAGYSSNGVVTVTVTNIPAATTIIPTIPPAITGFSIVNGNVVITGTNAQATGIYYLLTSTNVALPLSQWVTVATNEVDTDNNFTFTGTNVVTPGGQQQFYILSSTNSNH
jgi:hypothetical protein